MGCVSSKESKKTHLHPNDHVERDDVDSRHLVSLTSSSYGLLNIERPPSCQGSFLSFHRKSKKYQAITTCDDSSVIIASGPDVEPALTCRRMRSKSKDNNGQNSPLLQNDMETINTWELMEGLEDTPVAEPCTRSPYSNKVLRLPMPSKPPISFEWPHVSNSSLLDSGSPVWKKYYAESEKVKKGLILCAHVSPSRQPSSPINESPRRALACMPFVKSLRRLPSCSSLHEQDDSRSAASSTDILPDRSPSPGLKLLLSPANSPSYYQRPSTKRAGIHVASFSFDGNTENLRKASHLKFKRSFDFRKRSSRQPSMDSPKALQDVPLFDPSVMATFEQAIMATAECSREDMRQHSQDMLQQSTDEITTNSSSSDRTWPSSEMASDAESIPQCRQKQETQTCARLIPSVVGKREEFTGLLTKYEVRCPTRGDSKVVLYHTSLRGVRKTYEDCSTVRVILKGLGVQVDERDVWMHAKYKEELLGALGDILKGVQLVPRLFIKGRYIGGAEEVKRLHENGSLARLMDGIAMDVFQRVCDGCGDVRFVPCLKCSGSCKVRNRNNEVSRCLVCNENGLILCPICTTST